MEEVPEPVCGQNDVLIRVLRAGICGTDLHIESWDAWAQRTIPVPMVIGHEFVGRVVEIGANVENVAVGDLVGAEGHIVCGRCRNCMAGRRQLCAASVGLGVQRPGAFAELVSIPAVSVWHHRSPIDLDVAAIFDPFGNAVHTALAFDVLGEDVLITGAGPIGCMAASVVRHAGARHIVVTDPNPQRRALAERMGATLTVDPTTRSLADAQREIGMLEGFDIALEMSGRPSALRDAVAAMAHGGCIAVLGIPTGEFSLDWTTVIFNMLTLKGIYGREIFETWYLMAVMVESGLDLTPVITHRFAADDFEQAFATARSGSAGKVILDWSER